MPPSPSPKHCEFDRIDGNAVCRACGRVVRNAPAVHIYAVCRPAASPGPGTVLKGMLEAWGIKATPTCRCNAMARQMDVWGPDECLAHMDDILNVMEETAKKRGLPFVRFAASLLVRRAVAKSRRS